jgi:hypothetical protein
MIVTQGVMISDASKATFVLNNQKMDFCGYFITGPFVLSKKKSPPGLGLNLLLSILMPTVFILTILKTVILRLSVQSLG